VLLAAGADRTMRSAAGQDWDVAPPSVPLSLGRPEQGLTPAELAEYYGWAKLGKTISKYGEEADGGDTQRDGVALHTRETPT
jgi:hypothetical protein